MLAILDRQRAHALVAALLALCCALGGAPAARAQTDAARVLIDTPVDDSRLVRLAGNTRPEATAANDRGRVPDEMPLPHMLLLLKRPAEREAALRDYITQLHRRSSPYFHRWLTAAQLGGRYGLSRQDLATITTWLQQRGFTVNTLYPGLVALDFSGTAGEVRAAFHTELHALSVRGVRHIANMSDPQIPAALAAAVAGIVSLHDFRPHPALVPRAAYTESNGAHAVVPADLATIYNLTPLFTAGTTGQNQTVVVIEDSNVSSTADWSTFRSTFGLSTYSSGSFTQVHPGGDNACTNPGATGDEHEAILDAEWASAAAPGAAIELASCADTTTTFGGLLALQNLLNGSSPPPIVSISYLECEVANGSTANQMFSSTYQQAVAEGVSVFVAAGDWGAAGCDAASTPPKYAQYGIAVNGWGSTAYNVAVGGTDFGDSYAGTGNSYWSATNTATYGSALSYVPEIPWNDSCGSVLIATYEGYSTTYGSGGYCNSSKAVSNSSLTITAGGGGPSGCATGAATIADVVSGSCAGTPKPSWQSGVAGNPADGVRDLPDVSLFAANGVWGDFYVYCDSSQASCSTAPSSWASGGGTSFASPILAGIQALVNQGTGSKQGNPNTVYYILAASQAASGLACNSTSGNAVSSGCVFYDVTLGDMDVDCEGTNSCYLPASTYGAMSTSDSAYGKAYGAATGWDFATGLGSINAANLVKYWNSSDIALSASGNVTASGQLSYTLTVLNHGPQSASVVVTTVLPAGLALVSASSSGCTQTGQTVSCTVGSGALAVNTSATLTVLVQPSSPGAVSLVFTASSSNGDLDPADGSVTVPLNSAGTSAGGGGDGPLPPWANVALAVLLLGIAGRSLRPASACRR
jgi:uncharacterized repeat protein (TIGR01451 family)